MQIEPEKLNVLSLAYLGDSVWELFVRERVVLKDSTANHADRLHRAGIKYVNAYSQCQVIKSFIDDGILSEKEIALVKRARNHRTATKSKNTDPVTYKWATAFETLLGSLQLQKDEARLLDIMEKAATLIEQKATAREQHAAKEQSALKNQNAMTELKEAQE